MSFNFPKFIYQLRMLKQTNKILVVYCKILGLRAKTIFRREKVKIDVTFRIGLRMSYCYLHIPVTRICAVTKEKIKFITKPFCQFCNSKYSCSDKSFFPFLCVIYFTLGSNLKLTQNLTKIQQKRSLAKHPSKRT